MPNDNLKKLSEAASSEAANSLQKLLGKEVRLTIANVAVEEAAKYVPKLDKSTMAAGVQVPITGSLAGTALLAFKLDHACVLSDILVRRAPGSTKELTELDKSALKEMGNVIGCSYVASLSQAIDTELIESPPEMMISPFGDILDECSKAVIENTAGALMIEMEFHFEPQTIVGYYYLFFSTKDINTIMAFLDSLPSVLD